MTWSNRDQWPAVRISGDGTATGTHVTVDGKEIPCAGATWHFEPGASFANVTLNIDLVDVDMLGDLRRVDVQHYCPGCAAKQKNDLLGDAA